MLTEKNIRKSFRAVKLDTESMKNEISMLLKRIAHLENKVIEIDLKPTKITISKSNKKSASSGKKKPQKPAKTWREHLTRTQKANPKKTLKQAMQIASKTWKKEKAKSKKKKR